MAVKEKIRRSNRHAPKRASVARTVRPKHRKPVMVDLKKRRLHAAVHTAPKSIYSYSKALRFLSTLSDFERLRIVRYNSENFNLERMRVLLKKLGSPQDHFRSVHVAGTKGKGSTCAMVAGMLPLASDVALFSI